MPPDECYLTNLIYIQAVCLLVNMTLTTPTVRSMEPKYLNSRQRGFDGQDPYMP